MTNRTIPPNGYGRQAHWHAPNTRVAVTPLPGASKFAHEASKSCPECRSEPPPCRYCRGSGSRVDIQDGQHITPCPKCSGTGRAACLTHSLAAQYARGVRVDSAATASDCRVSYLIAAAIDANTVTSGLRTALHKLRHTANHRC